MSRKWKWWTLGFAGLALATGVSGVILDWKAVWPNLMGTGVGVFLTLSIAIWLIEGPILTARRRLVESEARRVAELAHEIAWLVLKGHADWLASELDPHIDMYTEARGDYVEHRAIQREVFRRVREDVPPEREVITTEDFRRNLTWILESVQRIRKSIPADIEVRAIIRSVSRQLDTLETLATTVGPKSNGDRFRCLGVIGDAWLDLEDASNAVVGSLEAIDRGREKAAKRRVQ